MAVMYNNPADYDYDNWGGWYNENDPNTVYHTNPFKNQDKINGVFYYNGIGFADISDFANYIKDENKYSELPFFIQQENAPVSNNEDDAVKEKKYPRHAPRSRYYERNGGPGGDSGGPPPNGESENLGDDDTTPGWLKPVFDALDEVFDDPEAWLEKHAYPDYQYNLLDINDYKTETPEALQRYAKEGMGKDWLSSAFHSQADSIAQGAINERKQIDDVVSRSGFQNTGFAGQAKELSRANQASGEIGTWLDVEDKNKSFMQNAQQQVLDIDNYNKKLGAQIGQFNAQQDLNKYQFDLYRQQGIDQIKLLQKANKDKDFADMFGGFSKLAGYVLSGPSGGTVWSMLTNLVTG